ncbi:MAG TPA: carbon-nitrogen hydrolase family protein [Streptosporangiaceae bacterium]|nr:carbon-nitrogen hydrolase family protein [Streptosporangiaceae bacterium]
MRVALCQIPVSGDPAVNLARVKKATAQAAADGADLAIFPEATQVRFGSDLRHAAEPLDGPFGTALASAARDHATAIVAGVFEPAPGGLVHNTAVGYDSQGSRCAAYRKIHLFDALGQRESDLVAPGAEAVIADFDGLRVGLITCYDIRFPELARALTAGGAQLLVVLAAWGAGLFKEEHWVTLVRARAIENTVWVAAVGQVPDVDAPPVSAPTGVGRSMLVDPMGTVRIDLGSRPGIAVGDIDLELTQQVRAVLPCLAHRRPDLLGDVRMNALAV